MQIIVSEHALEETDVRLFPASKNRSRRIHKKLVKRFGGEFQKQPCIFQMGDKWVAHPVMYDRLQREIAHRQRGHVNMAYAGQPW